MVDTSGTCGWMEHSSLDESHTGIVGGGHREDMTSGSPGSWISPHVLGMWFGPQFLQLEPVQRPGLGKSKCC